VKSPLRGITARRPRFIIPRVVDPQQEGTKMLQWRNGRLVGVLVALAVVAMAIGNWGWERFTWGW
jgi:hypothetical protein